MELAYVDFDDLKENKVNPFDELNKCLLVFLSLLLC